MRNMSKGLFGRGFACIALSLGLILGASSVQAQSWQVQDLGPTMAVWANHAPSVTSDGDAAWTRMDTVDNAPVLRARAYIDGQVTDLHAVGRPEGYGLSFAHDLSAQQRVAGYFSDDRGN